MIEERKQQKSRNKRTSKLEVGFVATLILIVFRIPLVRIIGDEGNGYLAISWEIFSAFYLIFGYGYSKTVCRMVESRISREQYRNSIKTMETVFATGFLSSLVGAALVFFLAKPVGNLFFDGNMIEVSLKLFAPLLALNCMVGIFRGCFEGMGTAIPTRVSRLVEAIITATGTFLFVFAAGSYGAKVGALLHNEHFEAGFHAAGVVAGYLCGSVLACFFLSFVYVLQQKGFGRLQKKDMSRGVESRGYLVRMIFSTLPMVILEVFFLKLYRLVNLYLYGRSRLQGENRQAGIDLIGSYYGKISVLMALAIVILLFFVEENKKSKRQSQQNEFKSGKQLMADRLERLFALALPITANFLVLSGVLLKALYGNGSQTDSLLMGIGGISVIFAALGVFLSRTMLSLERKKQVIIFQLAAFAVQTAIVVILNRQAATEGFSLADLSLGVGELVFWILFSVSQLISLIKFYRLRLPWGRMLIVPIIQTSVMLLVELVFVQLLQKTLPAWLVCLLAAALGTVFHQLTKKVPALNME